jgi:hypothetical protein
MQRVTQNSLREGVVLVIPMPGKKGSGLHPSEKELPEWRSVTKIPLGIPTEITGVNSSHA